MTRALVALGSNLGPRELALRAASEALGRLPGTRVTAVARPVETAPIGCPPGSGRFLNGACLLETRLGPEALLAELLAIEARAGRRRGEPNAPRTLDLDLLLWDDAVLATPGLTLPHPRLHERLFVLEPAAELAPDWVHPVLGLSLGALRDARRALEAELAAAPCHESGGELTCGF